MEIANSRYPLVNLPSDVQFLLALIKEELKSRKLFNVLHDVGFEDCFFQPHLDSLIMRSIGLDDDNDETFKSYDAILEKRSRKIDGDNDSIVKQALKAHHELIDLKKKKSAKKI